jgi:SAM-dependent methyltransferase
MIRFNKEPLSIIKADGQLIYTFEGALNNIDEKTVKSFGEEWSKFSSFSPQEIKTAGDQYFDIVPEHTYLQKNVLDVGCGTGRWSKYLSSKAGFIEAIDPSDAVFSAARLLQENKNVRISRASVDNLPFNDESFDLVFSLGVLHHIPDTRKAMHDAVQKVRQGGYFLVYLYYNLDNRGPFFKSLFALSNMMRYLVSGLPSSLKRFACDMLAISLYMPFVLLSRFFVFLRAKKALKYIPLSYYHDKSFNIIRNDSLDRFGTPLEQRFSKNEIIEMMKSCGLEEIVVSEKEPYWHAIGKKI